MLPPPPEAPRRPGLLQAAPLVRGQRGEVGAAVPAHVLLLALVAAAADAQAGETRLEQGVGKEGVWRGRKGKSKGLGGERKGGEREG